MLSRDWPVVAVVVAQLAIVAAIPFRAADVRARGADVTLRTVPVDPFDTLSGYHVALAYEAEQPPPGAVPDARRGDAVWVTVRRAEPAWDPVSVTIGRPPEAADEVSIRATWDGRRASIANAGKVFIPEADRERADDAMRAAESRGLVDLRVTPDGDAAVLRLRVGGETFGE